MNTVSKVLAEQRVRSSNHNEEVNQDAASDCRALSSSSFRDDIHCHQQLKILFSHNGPVSRRINHEKQAVDFLGTVHNWCRVCIKNE